MRYVAKWTLCEWGLSVHLGLTCPGYPGHTDSVRHRMSLYEILIDLDIKVLGSKRVGVALPAVESRTGGYTKTPIYTLPGGTR